MTARLFGMGLVLALAAGLVVLAIRAERRETALIASGTCQVVHEEWYQPPPTYRSSGDVRTIIHHAPYLRALWRCEGGERFWRRAGQ